MAETAYLGSRGRQASPAHATYAAGPAELRAYSAAPRPATVASPPTLALSQPDRNARVAAAVEAAKLSASLRDPAPLRDRTFDGGAGQGYPSVSVSGDGDNGPIVGGRPQTAPAGGLRAMGPMDRQFGRTSLYDRDMGGETHQLLAPTVTRDLEGPRRGFPTRGPDEFLRKGDGRELKARVKLRQLLAVKPVNRDPPFRPGNGGVRLSWESVPPAASIFRHLYDNGTINFVSLRWGNHANEVTWGTRNAKRKVTYWSNRPTDVQVGKWLPIFLEGIREYEEPYRFLSIMGSHDLITEAAGQLCHVAADCVAPLKKALDTREPTVVAVALELMKAALHTDPAVAGTWMPYIGQFAQPLNLFLSKRYSVNMGYLSPRKVRGIQAAIHDVLVLLQQHCGFDASALMRRHMRVDPIVSDTVFERRARQAKESPAYQPWQQYTKI
mmetsp:Transcript_33148/g.98656  ORF Transcript_33148/g.98656 Transcript_33148/m.98656 type:complete len:440 (-) Transcript_33148:238-1557(-)